jgi:phage terminase large subunit GpA-like protein
MFEGGRFNLSRTPFAAEPMQRLSLDDMTQLVLLMCGTQTFKTAAGLAWLAYIVYYGAGPIMHVRPKKDSVREFVRERVDPLWNLACLRGKVAPRRSRSAANTANYKEFNGGFLFACGTHAPDDLAAKTVRFYWQDETDREEPSAGKEGPAHQLVRKRVTRYGSRAKGLQTSSPTTERGPIWQMWLGTSQADYYVPCPRCGHMQVLQWQNLHCEGDPRGPETEFHSWYDCPSCHLLIAEWQKTDMLAKGAWVHAYPERPAKGYRLSSLYSPVGWRSWKMLAADFAAATDAYRTGDPGPMQVFRNTDLAEPWEPQGEDEVPTNVLMGRREPWPEDAIPEGIRVLTCAVDVHDDRLDCHVLGYGLAGERWTIDYRVIPGGPVPDEFSRFDWDYLDDLRRERFRRADGVELPIAITLVDLGGHRTDDAYKYTRSRNPRQVVGVFGRDDHTHPRPVVERQARTDEKRRGAKYRIVGTDPAKKNLFACLRNWEAKRPGGPNTWHFPLRDWCDSEWFKQLNGEHEEWVTTKRGRRHRIYVQHRHDNHVLDTAVYSYAGFRVLEIEGRLRGLMNSGACNDGKRSRPPGRADRDADEQVLDGGRLDRLLGRNDPVSDRARPQTSGR